MSITGLCQVCESAEATHSCERCGAVACEAHYDRDLDYCTQCAVEVRRARGGVGDGESAGERDLDEHTYR